MKKVSAVIVAAGSGSRMGAKGNKVYLPVLGKPVLLYTVEAFRKSGCVDEIIVVTGSCDLELCRELCGGDVVVVAGGESRQASVYAGLQAARGDVVLVHDGARALVTPKIIQDTLDACLQYGAAAVGVKSKDTLKILQPDGFIAETPDRELVWQVQTPQAFDLAVLKKAHAAAVKDGVVATDDCAVAEHYGIPVKMIAGSYENIKLTTPEDLAVAERILKGRLNREDGCGMRIGQGYDVHRLVEDRALILCGVKIPYEKGLLGHSDADVALHALADALLGAAALGDIGRHFPDTDARYAGADSMELLSEVVRMVRERGYAVANADVTIICQRPKLAAFIPEMQQNVADVLGVRCDRVNIKATTTEKLGFAGRGEGISAMAVALLEEKGCTDLT